MPPDRLAHGYRWEDEQWKEEPQLPDGAFGAMGGMLTSMRDLGALRRASTSAPGRRATVPRRRPSRRASLREMQQVWRAAAGHAVTRDADGAVQLNAGGYGYGLGITQTCDFGHIVAHSGGLPGFGSQMRWLPEYGVGIIAHGQPHLHRLGRRVRRRPWTLLREDRRAARRECRSRRRRWSRRATSVSRLVMRGTTRSPIGSRR